jgi:hypothetical protein
VVELYDVHHFDYEASQNSWLQMGPVLEKSGWEWFFWKAPGGNLWSGTYATHLLVIMH